MRTQRLSQSSSHLLDVDLSEYEDSDEDLEVSNDPVPSESDDHEAIQYSSELFQKSAALFLLGLKEKHKLSQVALQGVLEGVTKFTAFKGTCSYSDGVLIRLKCT